MTGGTNPNRCFFFTGTNHGTRRPKGRASSTGRRSTTATTPCRRAASRAATPGPAIPSGCEDAGVSWQIYQNQEKDFFALNPLLGFRTFRDANAASVPQVSPARSARQQALYEKGIRTRDLDLLKADVVAGRLPQVSWICPTASGSEHPARFEPGAGRGLHRAACWTR